MGMKGKVALGAVVGIVVIGVVSANSGDNGDGGGSGGSGKGSSASAERASGSKKGKDSGTGEVAEKDGADPGSLTFSDYTEPVPAQKPGGEILDPDALGG